MPADSVQRRTILMADDDGEDCLLVRDALCEVGRACDLHFVHDGEELFEYLYRRGEFAEGKPAPRPDVILLDLKMPRKDGWETLRELKADPAFRQIPVIVLTTSSARDDIDSAYQCGANSYVTKPTTFQGLADILGRLTTYWFDVAQLPPRAGHDGNTH
jgi:CheY-like chemotaxis protein